ncbi:NirD/YgiW/YdeI family stress tolerance protein [Bibersteinia trehalosi]|nr:NirD/YgiW/YdeI family stress tolerance protein [Bibersteinia trehalosi]
MRKLLSLATLLTLSSVALAGFDTGHQTGGFNAGTGNSATVAQALKANQDDMPIQLTGKIIRQVDGDEFIFRDATGEIKIEVEDEAWQGQNITPNDTITIFGKIDKERFKSNTVDVYRIQKH